MNSDTIVFNIFIWVFLVAGTYAQKVDITSSLKIIEASHTNEQSKKSLNKNVSDKFGPNMPKLLEHVGTHLPQVVLCSCFLCPLYHYISNQLLYCKYKQITSFSRKKKEQGKRW